MGLGRRMLRSVEEDDVTMLLVFWAGVLVGTVGAAASIGLLILFVASINALVLLIVWLAMFVFGGGGYGQ